MSGPHLFARTRLPVPNPSVHVAMAVETFTSPMDRPELRVAYACGAQTNRGALLRDPGDLRRCPRCDFDGAQAARSMVYAGIAPSGLLKVGRSVRVVPRMQVQRLEPIAVAPGGHLEEGQLLSLLGAPAVGREWFEATPERLALVGSWMQEHAA